MWGGYAVLLQSPVISRTEALKGSGPPAGTDMLIFLSLYIRIHTMA